MGAFVYGQPISMRVFRSGTMALAQTNGYFGFSRRGHNKLDNLGNSEDWAVAGGDGSVFRKHDVRTRVATGLSEIEACGIGVSCKDHATSAEEYAVIGVSGNVIQELE